MWVGNYYHVVRRNNFYLCEVSSAMKQFDIPEFYRSPIISRVKTARNEADRRKQDLSPTVLDFGPVEFLLARHFGFCYGVENAIEISYRALEENPGKRIFLLSQMIHNQLVNADLVERGIRFIMDTEGNQFVSWDELTSQDIVIIPAFGTTLEIEGILKGKGIAIERYNTTCPFVEKVWKRSAKIGSEGHTVVIHGKHNHEETRATYSHAASGSPSIIVKDLAEAQTLSGFISGDIAVEAFERAFAGRMSVGFNPSSDLVKLGVVNQTTMLATETQQIADLLKQTMTLRYGQEHLADHFADTRDTLCYATNDNQSATYELLKSEADLAIVVGGYNSSNTSHIVELCEEKLPTFFINSESEILDGGGIRHFLYHSKTLATTREWLPSKAKIRIILTSGASCPDSLVERVMMKILGRFDNTLSVDTVIDKCLLDV